LKALLRKRAAVFTWFYFVFTASVGWANDRDQQVSDLFAQQDYAQAEKILLDSFNRDSSSDWATLGTLAYHQNRVGEAYVALRYAASLNPFDWGIRRREQHLRDLHSSRMGIYEFARAHNWTELAAGSLVFRLVGLLLLLVLVSLTSWAWTRRKLGSKFIQTPTGTVWLVTVVAFFVLVGIERWGALSEIGVVNQGELIVRSGPSREYLALATLRRGMEIVLTGEKIDAEDKEQWVQVRFESDRLAWVPSDSLLLLPGR
jgi:hypothetical protein